MSSRAQAAGATRTATTSRLPSACTETTTAAATSSITASSTRAGGDADRPRRRAVEADREQTAVQEPEQAEHRQGDQRRDDEVLARDREHVAEEQLLDARRGGRHEREQRAEAERRRDHDAHRGVAIDAARLAETRDAAGRGTRADGAARNERQAEQRGADEPREHAVRETLGAVGHAVEQDPAAEPAADEADERDLEEGVLHERLAPGPAQPLPGAAHPSPWSWWCAGRIPRDGSPLPSSTATIEPP